MTPRSYAAGLLLLAVLCLSQQTVDAATVCLLKLKIDPKQSSFSGKGTMSAPINGIITDSKLRASGHIWLRVPATSSCPPSLTATNIDDLLQQASLEMPMGSQAVTFDPKDAKSNVTSKAGAEPIAQMDVLGLGLGLTGTEPLAPTTVTVGKGTAAEARAAAGTVCTQFVLLNGTLDMTSKLSGPRKASLKNVAFNRTVSAGISVAKDGEAVSNITLVLQNVTVLWNITPQSTDGKTGTPGVEFTSAKFAMSGEMVATADLSKATSWQEVKPAEVAWGSVRRLDTTVVVGATRAGKPRYIGENSTIPQECKPTRVLDGSGLSTATTTKSAAQGAAAAGLWQSLLVAAVALAAAVL